MDSKNYIILLKEILVHSGWTQEKLATELGVTFAALNRWLRGHASPQRGRLGAILKLHREWVGFAPVSTADLKKKLGESDKLKIRNIQSLLKKTESLVDELLLEHTYNTNAIEGSTLTYRETEEVLFVHRVIPEKSMLEHLEATNHAAILKEILLGRASFEFSEELIKNLHRRLFQGIREDAGSYSNWKRGIRGVPFELTHPEDIPEEMSKWVQTWNLGAKRNHHFLEFLASMHAAFELIHPFGDGNGRIGRLLMALGCLEKGYPPVIVENKRKSDYYDTLLLAQTKTETPFVCFLIEEMEETHRKMKKYF